MSRTTASVVALAMLTATSALLSSCGGPTKKYIIPGDVEVDPNNPRFLKASFTVADQVAGSPIGLSSHGTGGACLVADLNRWNIPDKGYGPNGIIYQSPYLHGKCDYNDQCQNGLDAGWYGYCIENSCWTRPAPDADYCVRSANLNGGKPWALGQRIPIPFRGGFADARHVYVNDKVISPIEGVTPSGGKNRTSIKWRVHTCLNAAEGDIDNKACARSRAKPAERLHTDGHVRE